MTYLKFVFVAPPSKQEVLIALLASVGLEAFEELPNQLIGYLKKTEWTPEKKVEMKNILGSFNTPFHIEEIPHENWNSVWESNFSPIIIDDFCAVRADFHPPNSVVQHDLVINPKMAFGTGHHETTYMMIETMRDISFQDKTVLDYGCGTGVLAILASKLGAVEITAIDNDPAAFENTLENIQVNSCPNIKTQLGDMAVLEANTSYQIILANINRNVILNSISALYDHIQSPGYLITSGYLKEDEELILQKAITLGFELVETTFQNDWVCHLFELK